jgi:hypothetical protein
VFDIKEVSSIARALQDASMDSYDAIYVVAEALDNACATLVDAYELYSAGIPIAIAGWDTNKFGYPGYRAYRQGLVELGVCEEDIVVIPPVDLEHGNTHTEALAFAKYVGEVGWKSVAIVAPTVHQPRAFLTMLAAILEAKLEVRLYNIIASQPWNTSVTHSQGKVSGTMEELLEGEMKRIRDYSNNGHVALGEEVFRYLRWRDGA